MKYLVLSDSHGNVDNMVRAVELVKPQGIIHLGDGWRDVEPLVDAASRPMMMNPGSIGDPRRPTYGVLEFRDGQIYPSVFRLDA